MHALTRHQALRLSQAWGELRMVSPELWGELRMVSPELTLADPRQDPLRRQTVHEPLAETVKKVRLLDVLLALENRYGQLLASGTRGMIEICERCESPNIRGDRRSWPREHEESPGSRRSAPRPTPSCSLADFVSRSEPRSGRRVTGGRGV